MYKGIDTCAPVSAEAARKIAEDGFSFVGRYLAPESGETAWKVLKKAEAQKLCAAGLRLLAVWETTADRFRGGAKAGQEDGARAYALAKKLEIPKEAILYFAVDYDARTTADHLQLQAYLTAAREQTGEYRIGVYGSYNVVNMTRYNDAVFGFWQCVAWSYGNVSSCADVYQSKWQDDPECVALARRYGFAIDIDECQDLDAAGTWTYRQEDTLTDKEVYEAVQRYAASLPLPTWATDELSEAQELGITDGMRPMELVPRYQAAIMAKRAMVAALREAQPMDDKAVSGLLTDE